MLQLSRENIYCARMCVCVCVRWLRVCVRECTYASIPTYMCTCVRAHVRTRDRTRVRTQLRLCEGSHVCVCMRARARARVCERLHVRALEGARVCSRLRVICVPM